ncbi:MAG: type II toxin-antitoxin system HicB family antitoxin [Candidatus Gracilibacteria bacterium]
MIIQYINEIMKNAKYEILEGGEGFYGEIIGCPGVWAQSNNLETCRKELQEILEEWILLKVRKQKFVPKTSNYDLNQLLCEK